MERAGSDAGRERDRSNRIEGGLEHCLGDPLGEPAAVLQGASGEDDRELLATDSADIVARADRAAENLGDPDQDGVAERMAVDVVDLLEVVEIDHHERGRVLLRR